MKKINNKFKNRKISIKLMCDYTATALWYNGANINIKSFKKIPYSVRIMNNKFNKWTNTWENFKFYKTTKFENKKIENSLKFKTFIKEGYTLAKIIRKKFSFKYTILYFNEKFNDYELII